MEFLSLCIFTEPHTHPSINFPSSFSARSRLYRRRLLTKNARLNTVEEMYQMYVLLHRSQHKMSGNVRHANPWLADVFHENRVFRFRYDFQNYSFDLVCFLVF